MVGKTAMRQEKQRLDLKKEAFKRMESMHPHMILLYVSMIGSAIIFLFTVVAFTVSKPQNADFLRVEFPKSFIISSFILLLSSYTVSRIMPAFEEDNLEEIKKWLGATLLLGVLFSISQVTGWRELESSNILFAGNRSGAYLYVISGLHVLHIAGLLLYGVFLLMECHKTSKDAVRHLVYTTNPYQKVKFQILTDFWHFVDGVWIALFFYFLFSF